MGVWVVPGISGCSFVFGKGIAHAQPSAFTACVCKQRHERYIDALVLDACIVVIAGMDARFAAGMLVRVKDKGARPGSPGEE
eukprot:1161384-Pelagomonas_calceolata.AAC.1